MGLSLKLLGEFALRDENGAVLSLPTRKTRALLGYLAANVDKPQPRERLMALLWSSFGEKQARHNLNQALLSIRKLTPDGATLLDGDVERVTLRGDAIDIDLARFHRCLDSDPAAAVKLYDGPFLEGLAAPDPGFEDWLAATRLELHDQACNALERAVDATIGKGDTDAAVSAARRLVAFDPLREDGHRRLMHLLHDGGDRAGALRQYQACVDLLEKELQVEPDSATKALYERIRKGDLSTGASEAAPTRDAPTAETPPSRPDKPSIAVLPFANLSGDPEQEYFADGMTDDIITGLSRFRSLFVIARNSTFAYKGKSPDVREVARDLGVRYVLEGSVRRSGQRIRITAQLIDADTGIHLWANRYDRQLEDIFTIQDEGTEAIVAATAPQIGESERERAQRRPPDNLDVWGLYQRGLAAYYSSTEAGLTAAIKQFDRVNEIDPDFAPAFAMAAGAAWRYAEHFEPNDRSEFLNQALKKAYAAITLDPRDVNGMVHAAMVHSMLGQHELAVSKLEEAISVNSADASTHHFLGMALRRAGRAAEAIPHIDQAMRLSPNDIFRTGMLTDRAFVLFDLERYDEAFDWAQRARLSPHPRTLTFAVYAAALVKLERLDEARAAIKDLLSHAPELTYRTYRNTPAGTAEVMERLAGSLREAGLPK